MVLQNLRFPEKGICEIEELYNHEGSDIDGNDTLDLDGYFNLFYIKKHRKFTAVDRLAITFTAKGYRKAFLMHDRNTVSTMDLDGSGSHTMQCPWGEHDDGVYWLRLTKDEKTPESERKVTGFFEADLAEEDAAYTDTSPEVAVAICTFRREPYVIRNLTAMISYFEKNRELASHYHVFLVDNGKTLAGRDDFKELQARAPYLTLIENRNTGGTGGFTRGMEEAIKRRDELGLTNLMLLDDDAVFDPELFLRLHSLLASLKKEYRDITVGGAMWREDMPWLQHASGEWHEKFKVTNPMLMLDLRDFETCTKDEMREADPDSGLYSGWWCCTYSMKIITKENLPMPLFIHRDDILFCRQHADMGIMFLNGIGVWHQGFELRFPAVTEYYNTRNELITAAVMDNISPAKAARWAIKQLSGPLLSFRYTEMDLAYRGIMDFLKGPDWLDRVDGEKLHKEISEKYKKEVVMKPLKELLSEALYEKLRVRRLTEEARQRAILDFWGKRMAHGNLKKYITLNGWMLPAEKKMGLYCNSDSPWTLYRRGTVLLYEPEADRGHIERRRHFEMLRCAGMAARVTFELLLHYREMELAYSDRAGR